MSSFRVRLGKQMMASGLALFVDRVLGEPASSIHPVALFGQTMTWSEVLLWRDTKRAGASYGLIGILLASGASACFSPSFIGTLMTTYLACAEKSLLCHATSIGSALEVKDVASARTELRSLVGRDVSNLDERGVTRAVIESVAENSSDAVIAPLLYGALFGSMGALVHRSINTMDAMVGYKNKKYHNFGWFCARLDDLVNYLPARITALLAVTIPNGTRPKILQIVDDGAGHPSPNAGVVEASYAHKLGIRLGGMNFYGGSLEHRPEMGVGLAPQPGDIARAVALSRASNGLFATILISAGALLYMRSGSK